MADIKLFKVGSKVEELKADATAALDAAKRKIELLIVERKCISSD